MDVARVKLRSVEHVRTDKEAVRQFVTLEINGSVQLHEMGFILGQWYSLVAGEPVEVHQYMSLKNIPTDDLLEEVARRASQ